MREKWQVWHHNDHDTQVIIVIENWFGSVRPQMVEKLSNLFDLLL